MQYSNLRKVHADNKHAAALPAPCGIWISGASGTGKTTLARNLFPDLPIYIKETTKWWDNYQDETVVLLDDLDPSSAKGLDRSLKLWGDQWDFPAEIKGASTGRIRPHHFLVTS